MYRTRESGCLLGLWFKAIFSGTEPPPPVLTQHQCQDGRTAGACFGGVQTVFLSPGFQGVLGPLILSILIAAGGGLRDREVGSPFLLPQTASLPWPHLVPTSLGVTESGSVPPAWGPRGTAAPHISFSLAAPFVSFPALSLGQSQEHLIAWHCLRAAEVFCFLHRVQKLATK